MKHIQLVEYILDNHYNSRYDDRILYQYALTYLYHKRFKNNCLSIELISEAPAMDTLGRIRRRFQESGKYLCPEADTKRERQQKKIYKEIL